MLLDASSYEVRLSGRFGSTMRTFVCSTPYRPPEPTIFGFWDSFDHNSQTDSARESEDIRRGNFVYLLVNKKQVPWHLKFCLESQLCHRDAMVTSEAVFISLRHFGHFCRSSIKARRNCIH